MAGFGLAGSGRLPRRRQPTPRKWPKDAFQQKTEADAIKALYGKAAEESDKVKLDAPGDRRERRRRSDLDQQHACRT